MNSPTRSISFSDERSLKDIARKAMLSTGELEAMPITFVISTLPNGVTTISSFFGIVTIPPGKTCMTFNRMNVINTDLLNDVITHGQDPLWEWLYDNTFEFIADQWMGRNKLPTRVVCQIGAAVRTMFLADHPEAIDRINELTHVRIAQSIVDFN